MDWRFDPTCLHVVCRVRERVVPVGHRPGAGAHGAGDGAGARAADRRDPERRLGTHHLHPGPDAHARPLPGPRQLLGRRRMRVRHFTWSQGLKLQDSRDSTVST